MASFYLSVNTDMSNDRDSGGVEDFFRFKKGLTTTFKFEENGILVLKYGRKGEDRDNNYFASDDAMFFVVGTCYYKGVTDDTIIKGIADDFYKIKFEDIVQHLDGVYNLIIILKKQQKCIVVTSVSGANLLYLYNNKNQLIISSSILSISSLQSVKLNEKAIMRFIRCESFVGNETPFLAIAVMESASIYEFDMTTLTFKHSEYWRVPIADKGPRNGINYWATKLDNELCRILRNLPMNDTLYDFTGGHDSRFILSTAYKLVDDKRNISTFFFGPKNSVEEQCIDKACRNLNIRYVHEDIPQEWHKQFSTLVKESFFLTDGMENIFDYATVLLINKIQKEKYLYSVNGLHGGSYRGEFNVYFNSAKIFLTGACYNSSYYKDIFKRKYKSINFVYEELKDYKNIIQEYANSKRNYDISDHLYFIGRLRRRHGSNISTSNMFCRIISPYMHKNMLMIALSCEKRYKRLGRLIRYLASKNSMTFALQKMQSGSPFIEINFKNIVYFAPKAVFIFRKIIRKLFQLLFNVSIWGSLTVPDYDKGAWLRYVLCNDAEITDYIKFDKMILSYLFNRDEFNRFVKQAKKPAFKFYSQLGNIITVEMLLRNSKLESVNFNRIYK